MNQLFVHVLATGLFQFLRDEDIFDDREKQHRCIIYLSRDKFTVAFVTINILRPSKLCLGFTIRWPPDVMIELLITLLFARLSESPAARLHTLAPAISSSS